MEKPLEFLRANLRAVIRGFNIVTHEYFRDLSDRMTPAAVIPMYTPDEAIAELDFGSNHQIANGAGSEHLIGLGHGGNTSANMNRKTCEIVT